MDRWTDGRMDGWLEGGREGGKEGKLAAKKKKKNVKSCCKLHVHVYKPQVWICSFQWHHKHPCPSCNFFLCFLAQTVFSSILPEHA